MIKKALKLFFTILFVIQAVNSFGQREIKYGAKAGAGIASLSFDETEIDLSPLQVFHGGIFLDIVTNEHFSVDIDAIYSMKGVKGLETYTDTISGNTMTYDTRFKLSYIVIPILPTYKLNSGIYFQAGPYVALLLTAQKTGTKTTPVPGQPSIVEDIDESWTNQLNTTELGLAGGLGYQSKSGIGFSARYEFGLTDAFNYSGYSLAINKLMSVSISYVIGTKL